MRTYVRAWPHISYSRPGRAGVCARAPRRYRPSFSSDDHLHLRLLCAPQLRDLLARNARQNQIGFERLGVWCLDLCVPPAKEGSQAPAVPLFLFLLSRQTTRLRYRKLVDKGS